MFALHIDSLDDIEKSHRAFYEPDPDNTGGFRLKVTGIDKLRNSKRNEKDLRIAVEKKNRELSARIRELESKSPARSHGDMTPREQFFAAAEQRLAGLTGDAHAAEYAKIEAELQPLIDAEVSEARTQQQTRIQSMERTIRAETIKQAALRIVAEIGQPGAGPVLIPHITARLGCDNGATSGPCSLQMRPASQSPRASMF